MKTPKFQTLLSEKLFYALENIAQVFFPSLEDGGVCVSLSMTGSSLPCQLRIWMLGNLPPRNS